MGKQLGGRSEVLELPIEEAFIFMELDLEKEKLRQDREAEKFWLDFLSRIYSNPPQEGETPEFAQKRKEFMEAAKPKLAKPKEQAATKVEQVKNLGWSNIPQEEIDKALLRKQEEGVEEGG